MDIDISEQLKEIQLMNEEMIHIQSVIVSCIDNNEPFDELPDILQQYNILNDLSLFHDFLCLLNSISYSRIQTNQKNMINDIIINLKDQILQYFKKNEIYSIFKLNLPILLCLYENEIISYDQISKSQVFIFGNYFLAEKIEHEGILEPMPFYANEMEFYYQNHLDEYIQYRKEYHSESDIAKFIRNDDIESFTDLIGHANIPLDSHIPPSLFESDINLAHNMRSLIEYAAAFGSLNIFKFLYCQLQTFPQMIFHASIIGGNPEIIHLLEEKGYKPNIGILYETIVNHRNDIFEYFIVNYEIELDFGLFIDSINSFNYYIMNELLTLHPEYLTNNNYANQIFSDICSTDFRVLFNILLSLPTIDINYKIDEKYMDYVSIKIFF